MIRQFLLAIWWAEVGTILSCMFHTFTTREPSFYLVPFEATASVPLVWTICFDRLVPISFTSGEPRDGGMKENPSDMGHQGCETRPEVNDSAVTE
jgi:hypothetical protein